MNTKYKKNCDKIWRGPLVTAIRMRFISHSHFPFSKNLWTLFLWIWRFPSYNKASEHLYIFFFNFPRNFSNWVSFVKIMIVLEAGTWWTHDIGWIYSSWIVFLREWVFLKSSLSISLHEWHCTCFGNLLIL